MEGDETVGESFALSWVFFITMQGEEKKRR
jgi:hypothetical protein